jgi:hypothetical protein
VKLDINSVEVHPQLGCGPCGQGFFYGLFNVLYVMIIHRKMFKMAIIPRKIQPNLAIDHIPKYKIFNQPLIHAPR